MQLAIADAGINNPQAGRVNQFYIRWHADFHSRLICAGPLSFIDLYYLLYLIYL
jgi:hypothetical protein